MTAETLEFRTELKQLMEIIIHSLYSNKEIFLRELISNAADAIDKIRFDALNNPEKVAGDMDWQIRIIPDEKAGTLTISDNGIGMDRKTIVEDLGTIARSGTKEFLQRLKETDENRRPELIGQFGVGFYSSFMVADKVTVHSRMGDAKAGICWESDGQGSYTINELEKERRGTDIILHMREEEKEYLGEWNIRNTVKKFSAFIEHPIILITPKKAEKDEEEVPEGETTAETLNTQQAIWLRAKDEVTEEEYQEFYKHISHDQDPPAKYIHYAAEGTMEFKALLYIPAKKPFDLFWRDRKSGLHLYVKRVFIMDDCEKLLPRHLDFIKGVVDSSDLPLNVSRELLQEDRTLQRIRKVLVGKVLGTLKDMQENEYEDYEKFWAEFGSVIKAGVSQDYENREKLADLALFASTHRVEGKVLTLAQYVEAMPDDQEEIFYMTGETREMVENSPYMEHFKERNLEVLIMTDPVDELMLSGLPEYKGKKLKAIDRGELETDDDDKEEKEQQKKEFTPLLESLQPKLAEIKEIRLSSRLKESASCLVGLEGGMGAQMEKLMKEMGAEAPPQEKILELNPAHPMVTALREMHANDPADPMIEDYGKILYDQAVMAAGSKVKDPAAFAARVNALLMKKVTP